MTKLEDRLKAIEESHRVDIHAGYYPSCHACWLIKTLRAEREKLVEDRAIIIAVVDANYEALVNPTEEQRKRARAEIEKEE
jgi:hypothetical protein